MVLLLAEQGDTSELISFLSAQLYNPGPHATLEPEFALRVCFEHKQYEAVVNIYQALKKWMEAVEAALEYLPVIGHQFLAKLK
ncbi:unnamed protein product, partial [Symbiodinium sp. KB8]